MVQFFTPNSLRSNNGTPKRRPRHAGRQRRPLLEALEERNLLTVNLISNYTGMNQLAAAGPNTTPGFVTIYTPPDTTGAAGPTSYVETANQGITIFTPKATGTTAVTDSMHDFLFTQGGLAQVLPIPTAPKGGTDYFSDVTCVWDNLAQRFIVGVQDVNGTTSNFDLAVSKSASPATLTTADWWFFQVNTSETNRVADYPGNLGFNADALVFTLNQNAVGGSGATSAVQITSIAISNLIAGNPITPFQSDFNGFSLRPTVMHDSKPGDPMWLLESTSGNGNTINVIRDDNELSNSPTFTTTTLNVNAYLGVVQPLQPDGTGLAPASGNGALWTHILKAAEANNTIVASDQISVSSTEDDARWYIIDVSGATPTLKDQGNVSAGNKTYVVFPSIDINSKGDIGMDYSESGTGTGQFMSMYVTGRLAGDAAGTMQTPVLVQAGVVNSTDGREGDLCGISVDSTPMAVTAPSDQTSLEGAATTFNLGSFTDSEDNFWAANEWAATGGSWGTAIGQFSLGDKGPWTVNVSWGDGTADSTFTATSPTSLGTLSHTYAEEGSETVTVKVTDTADGKTASKTFTVTVTDPPVTVDANSGGTLTTIAEGQSTPSGTVVGTFTDTGNPSGTFDPTQTSVEPEYVVVITWGNGSTDTVDSFNNPAAFNFTGGGTFQVLAPAHTYGEEGTYNISLTVTHDALSAVGPTQTASIVVSDPPVLANGVAVTGKESIAFAAPVATFMDPGGAEPNPADPVGGISSHYTATTDWGDGNPPSVDTITYSGSPGSTTGVFTVTGTHTFAEEGTFTATTIIDHEGVNTTVTSTSAIRDNYGLLVLDPTSASALTVSGNGSVTVNNSGAVVVDSSSPKAIVLSGNAIVTATEADVGLGGGFVTNGHATLNLLEPEFNHEAATPDPLGLALPPVPTTHFAAVHYSGGSLLTLLPGTYDGGIQVSGKGSIKLLPGVYYMNGGGFSVSGQGSVTGSNVLIVNAPRGHSDSINFSGQAIVNLTASAGLTGAYAPYNGITIFQDPASANSISVTGQASLTMTGVFYAPEALLMISGNGNTVVSTDTPNTGGEVIVFDTMVTGNGVLTINADPPTIPLPIDSTGTLIVNAGSNLTASHIVLGSLVIGGTAGSPATVTIAASDAVGNPLPAPAAASTGANAIPSAAQQPATSSPLVVSTDSVGALSAADQAASAQATSAALSGLSTGGDQALQIKNAAPNSIPAQSGAPASSNLAQLPQRLT